MKRIMAPMSTSLKFSSQSKRHLLTHTLAISNNRRRRSWLLDSAVTFMRKSQLRLTLLVLVGTPMYLAMMLEILISPKKIHTHHHMTNKNLNQILLKQQPQPELQPFSVT
jgi:hypothetical protein